MNKFIHSLCLAGLLLFALPAAAQNDVIYSRITKTNTLRCAYAEWPPFVIINPNTNEVSGLLKDLWEVIAHKLDLKITWETSIGWGQVTEAYVSNKMDMFCAIVWPDAGRMKNLLLSRPVFYTPVYLYARADDNRFDDNYDAVNNESATITGQEGDITVSILEQKFPKAKTAHIPPAAQQADMILNVVTGKGDVTLLDVPYAQEYMKNNPGKLKQVKGPPVMMMQNVIPMAAGEYQMKNMIDTVLTDLINDGTIAALIKKYEAVETYAPKPEVGVK